MAEEKGKKFFHNEHDAEREEWEKEGNVPQNTEGTPVPPPPSPPKGEHC